MLLQISVEDPPITLCKLKGGAITAPATITICVGESVTFNATGGGVEFLFYKDNNPLVLRSGSSNLATSTLITGNRIKVESFSMLLVVHHFHHEIVIQTVDNPVISLTSTAFASCIVFYIL